MTRPLLCLRAPAEHAATECPGVPGSTLAVACHQFLPVSGYPYKRCHKGDAVGAEEQAIAHRVWQTFSVKRRSGDAGGNSLWYNCLMAHTKSRVPRRIAKGYVIGRARFAKISAVEGIRLTAEMDDDFRRFDQQALSAPERRRLISKKYAKKS